MKYLLITTLLLSTAYSQCDANEDGVINVQDVVVNVNCILGECWTCDFDLTDVCVDIDGNEYKTIQIGNQLWMAENLKVTHYNNGDEIYFPYGNDEEWMTADFTSLDRGQYAHYDNDPENGEIYGNLYSGHVAIDSRGVCPDGWHVPTEDEWVILTENVGGYSAAGRMREIGFAHWDYPNISATNESCFTALPAGIIVPHNGWPFDRIGWQTEFWSSTQVGESLRIRYLLTDFHFINSGTADYIYQGFSIRCLED